MAMCTSCDSIWTKISCNSKTYLSITEMGCWNLFDVGLLLEITWNLKQVQCVVAWFLTGPPQQSKTTGLHWLSISLWAQFYMLVIPFNTFYSTARWCFRPYFAKIESGYQLNYKDKSCYSSTCEINEVLTFSVVSTGSYVLQLGWHSLSQLKLLLLLMCVEQLHLVLC